MKLGYHRLCWLNAVTACALFALLVGCDMEPTHSPVVAEKPQPPPIPLDSLRADADPIASTSQGDEPAEETSYTGANGQDSSGQGETSLPVAPGQGRATGAPSNRTRPTSGQRVDYVTLTAGVALPQLLPTGTAIGVSVDYDMRRPLPSNATQVLWVIEAGGNRKVEIPVRLDDRSGNLMTFAKELKPEHGPFRCHLQVVLSGGDRQPISPTVAMKF